MKALWLHQPYARLMFPLTDGHPAPKGPETRSAPPAGPMCPSGIQAIPGSRLDRDEWVAIVASRTQRTFTQIWNRGHRSQAGPEARIVHRLAELDMAAPFTELAWGAVLGLVRFNTALPIIDEQLGWWADTDTPDDAILITAAGTLERWKPPYDPPLDVSRFAPFGDYRHGRWALWPSGRPVLFPEPVPVPSYRLTGERAAHLGLVDMSREHPDVDELLTAAARSVVRDLEVAR